jgi:hypothetical protein
MKLRRGFIAFDRNFYANIEGNLAPPGKIFTLTCVRAASRLNSPAASIFSLGQEEPRKDLDYLAGRGTFMLQTNS